MASRHTILVTAWLILFPPFATAQSFHFVILGDRTGSTQPGVYEEVWKEAAAENPAFVTTIGDMIQGYNDATAESEWQAVKPLLDTYRKIPFYPSPGNHDIWSEAAERVFRKYAGHEPHYSFDFQQAHFTILDNSRSDDFSAAELAFLEEDLRAHAGQPVKFILSHKPSWLVSAVARNSDFAIQRLARKYGVQTVIAGHLHQMLHVDFDGVTYVSMGSAGGHLRASKRYEDGWFFGYALVQVDGVTVKFQIKELKAPFGEGRVTRLRDWGASGLVKKDAAAASAYRFPNPTLLTQMTLIGVRSNFSRTWLSLLGSSGGAPLGF